MRILIAGAGIAGLSLARALEQRGIEAQLVERQPNQPDTGAGLFLPGNAVRAIELLGLSKEVAAKAVPIKRQLILNARGKVLNSVETESLWHDCGPCLSLPHKDLRDILEVSLRRSTLSYRRSIAGLTQDSEGCVVTFDDGMAAQYDLVVGTDGIHSMLRNMVSLGGARYTGNVCWRFITKNITGIGCWTAMLGNGRTLLAIPISPTHVYVYVDLAVSTDNVQSFSQNSPLGPLFKDFAGPVFPLIECLAPDTYIHYSSLQEVRLKDWVKGRAVLLGDSAHGCSPNMAEGAGMAMEDALVLAEGLSRRHSCIGKACRAYVERRKPRTGWVQKQCRVRDRMRALPASPRAAILRLFGTVLYRRSYAPLLNPF